MNLDNYLNTVKLTNSFIQTLRDEDIDKRKGELTVLVRKFDTLDMKIAVEPNEEIQQTLRYIYCDLETYYRQEYKDELMGLFAPWGRGMLDYLSHYDFLSVGGKYFVRRWKNNVYMCMPVVSGHRNSHTITVKTPEEMMADGEINIPEGFSNPFLAMFSFYIDLIEAVQKKYGALHPKCNERLCECNFKGKCVREQMRVKKPCLIEVEGKEVK